MEERALNGEAVFSGISKQSTLANIQKSITLLSMSGSVSYCTAAWTQTWESFSMDWTKYTWENTAAEPINLKK